MKGTDIWCPVTEDRDDRHRCPALGPSGRRLPRPVYPPRRWPKSATDRPKDSSGASNHPARPWSRAVDRGSPPGRLPGSSREPEPYHARGKCRRPCRSASAPRRRRRKRPLDPVTCGSFPESVPRRTARGSVPRTAGYRPCGGSAPGGSIATACRRSICTSPSWWLSFFWSMVTLIPPTKGNGAGVLVFTNVVTWSLT